MGRPHARPGGNENDVVRARADEKARQRSTRVEHRSAGEAEGQPASRAQTERVLGPPDGKADHLEQERRTLLRRTEGEKLIARSSFAKRRPFERAGTFGKLEHCHICIERGVDDARRENALCGQHGNLRGGLQVATGTRDL